MALIDLIAQSGAKNFETFRKGWLPTTQEKAADEMARLNVKAKKQAVAYEPERQKYLKQKQKADLTSQEQATQLFGERMKKYKTDEQIATKEQHLDFSSRIVRGAFSQLGGSGEGLENARNIFKTNYEKLIEANDDEGDKMIKRFLDPDTPSDEAINLLTNFNSVMPLAQEALDKQKLIRMKSNRKMSEFQQYNAMIEAEIPLNEGQQDRYDKLSGKSVEDRSLRNLTFKQKKIKKENTEKLGKRFRKEYKTFISTDQQITKIRNALKSGDNTMMDIQVTKMLSNLEGSGIKAKSMYDIHNVPLGDLISRIKDNVSGFVLGTRTQEQKQLILESITELQRYNKLVLDDGKSMFRGIARKDDYDADTVVPFTSFDEVKNYQFWDEDQKIKYLQANPRLLPSKK